MPSGTSRIFETDRETVLQGVLQTGQETRPTRRAGRPVVLRGVLQTGRGTRTTERTQRAKMGGQAALPIVAQHLMIGGEVAVVRPGGQRYEGFSLGD